MRTLQGHRANQEQREVSNSGLRDSKSRWGEIIQPPLPVHRLRAGPSGAAGREEALHRPQGAHRQSQRGASCIEGGQSQRPRGGPGNPGGGCPELDPEIRTSRFGPRALTGGRHGVCRSSECELTACGQPGPGRRPVTGHLFFLPRMTRQASFRGATGPRAPARASGTHGTCWQSQRLRHALGDALQAFPGQEKSKWVLRELPPAPPGP